MWNNYTKEIEKASHPKCSLPTILKQITAVLVDWMSCQGETSNLKATQPNLFSPTPVSIREMPHQCIFIYLLNLLSVFTKTSLKSVLFLLAHCFMRSSLFHYRNKNVDLNCFNASLQFGPKRHLA